MQHTLFLSTTILLLVGFVFLSFSLWIEAILLYPSGSVFQITLGASVPVRSNKRGSVVFSSGFQYNYFLPSNVSNFKSTIVVARHVRDLDLRDTYSTIENLLEDLVEKQGKQTRSSLAFDVTGETSIGSRKDQRSQRSKVRTRIRRQLRCLEEEIQVWRRRYTGNNGRRDDDVSLPREL
ncbi:uncharacterized protein V1477_005930 [Vespula maculifrons]|uniref:Uncharacterized protein n=1 Tax=Vespula maculifrons TaxID=7453 RepID=A0ABD2CL37_VESMC